MNDLLSRLSDIIRTRRDADPKSSYVAMLSDKGLDAILKKVGEEATETVIAAKDGDPRQVIHETADLWFHTLVMLAQFDLDADAVLQELERRVGQSGLEEKANRSSETG